MEQALTPEDLQAKRAAHEQRFRDLLLGKRLMGMDAYTFQSRPADLLDDTSLLVFGGVDLQLEEATLCMGFNPDMELLDLQPTIFAKMSGKVPVTLIPREDADMLGGLDGLQIKDCSFQWMHYFELDEDFEPVSEPSFAPMELVLDFEGGEQLQLAGIHFQLMPDGQMVDPVYHPEGALLIARDPWTEIELAEEEE